MAHPGQPGVLLDGFGDYQKAWSRLRLTVGNTTTTGQYTHGPRGPFFSHVHSGQSSAPTLHTSQSSTHNEHYY